MNYSKLLALALIGVLVVLNCVQSFSNADTQTQPQVNPIGGQHVHGSGSPSNQPNNVTNGKEGDNKQQQPQATGRYLTSVGGYEQQQPIVSYQPTTTSYEVPVQQSYVAPVQQQSYVAPVQQSYVAPVQQSYVAPVQPTYQTQSYQQTQSYVAPVQQSYSAPVQTYEQPIVSTYQAPSYSNYSTQSTYQAPVQTYQAPVQTSYQQPSYNNYTTSSYQQPSYQQQSYQQSYQPTYQPQQQSYQQTYQPAVYSNYSQQSYQQPQSYQVPIVTPTYEQPSYQVPVQTYQQPSYSNYTTQTYSTPQVSSYQQTQSYQAPVVQTYQQPSYNNYTTSSYQQPSYQQQSYQPTYQPQQQSYQQTYQPAVYSNYSQQSYQQPQSYQVPIVTPTYEQPSYQVPVQTYQAPVQTYQQPSYSNYTTQTYSTPQVSSYQQTQSYQAPVVQTYQQPSYQVPVQTYQQPSYSNYTTQTYSTPQVSSYQQTQSYQAPVVQTYQQPSYQVPVQTYQAPVQTYQPQQQTYQGNSIFKRQMGRADELTLSPIENSTTATGGGSASATAAADDDSDMSTSDSIASPVYVPPPQQLPQRPVYGQKQQQLYQQVSHLMSNYVPPLQAPLYALNSKPSSFKYLDTQPEFTQSWADFSSPPGFLPIAFKNAFPNYLQQQQQYKQQYGGQQQQVSLGVGPQSIGFGYVTWSGPINPASFYAPVQLPYYYRVPPLSPFYSPAPPTYLSANSKPIGIVTQIYKAGYGKRSLQGHEAAPYQLLVDHLAAASDVKESTFSNISMIECPSKPTDYTCPQVLSAANKDQLKKDLCKYETILTGSVSLIPDTDKAQTTCGAMKLVGKPILRNEEDAAEFANKLAVVFAKDCQQIKQVLGIGSIESRATAASAKLGQVAQEQQLHMLVKATMPSNTKFMLVDGTTVDLLSGSAIGKDEIAEIMKSCPKQPVS